MEILNVFLVLCGLPLFFFLAGWIACYVLLVKYRFRMERRFDDDPPNVRAGRQAEWQP